MIAHTNWQPRELYEQLCLYCITFSHNNFYFVQNFMSNVCRSAARHSEGSEFLTEIRPIEKTHPLSMLVILLMIAGKLEAIPADLRCEACQACCQPFTPMGILVQPVELSWMSLDCMRKLELTEETSADTGSAYKLHT